MGPGLGNTIEKMGYNYRVNLKSLSTSYRPDRFEASKHFYLEMKKKLQELGYGKETMLRLDRMFFVYFRMCIGQERLKVTSHSSKQAIKIINSICEDSVVNNVIENYPVVELAIKQRFFLWLIKNKMKKSLYFLSKIEKI